MVFEPSGHDHDSQNQLYLILGTPRYFKNTRKHKIISESIILAHLRIVESRQFRKMGKTWGRQIPTTRRINSWES